MKNQYFFLIFMAITIESSDRCIFNDNEKAFINNKLWIITNFDTLESLNFNCSQIVNMSMWGFKPKPNKLIILDNSLNLKGLNIQPENEMFGFIFENFKGFDFKSNPFNNVIFLKYIYKVWQIKFSNFDFFNKQILINTVCNEKLLEKISNNNQFDGYMLILGPDVKFALNTCPLIFWNINTSFINLDQLKDSFIEKNILGFQNISNNLVKKMNSNIFQLDINLYHTDLNSNLLNRYVFTAIRILDLNGPITNIQEDLFKPFSKLQMIRFRMQNIQHILVRNNKWFNHLNSDLNIDPKNKNEVDIYVYRAIVLVFYQTFYNHSFYDYPEKDFCYFKNFPHNRLVMPKLMPNYKSKCSCTELFLIQYSYLFSKAIEYYLDRTPSKYYMSQYYSESLIDNKFTYCLNSSFEQILKKCNFEEFLNLCNIKAISNNNIKEEAYFYMYDWEKLSKYSYSLLSLYMNPIFSFISILLNLLVFLILSNKKEIPKEMNKMYTYLRLNSILNIIFIIIRLFKLMDICSHEDDTCRSIYSKSKTIQYFKIIFIRIIGNIFQSASNLTHITFTLSRYLTVSNNKSNFLNFIHRISFKTYTIRILIFSLLLNIHIFFEFSIYYETSSINQLKFFNMGKFQNYKQEPLDDYKENFSHSEYLILDIFQYIKIIFSDISYIIISFTIDLILFSYIKKSMAKKTKLTVSFVADVNRVIIGTQTENNNKTKNKINSLKNRMTLIIILNGFNFILFRLPLAIISFYGFVFRYDNEENKHKPNLTMYIVCRYFRFCKSLNEFFYFIYLNSIILQFFIFYKLDKNFKKSFKSIKINLKNKLQQRF
jgi:hypothetical protein